MDNENKIMEIQSRINLQNFEKKMQKKHAKEMVKEKLVKELKAMVHKKNNEIRTKKLVRSSKVNSMK